MNTLLDKINKHNPDSLPVVIFDPTWLEGCSARYHIDGSFKDIKTYNAFIDTVIRLYKNKEIIFAKTGGFWVDEITLTYGIVNGKLK